MEEPYKKKVFIDVVGSEPLFVPFSVQTKIPAIRIKQKVFDFGTIQQGIRKKIDMVIINKSSLEAQLILDLRHNEEVEGIKGLDIEYVLKKGEKESVMISLA